MTLRKHFLAKSIDVDEVVTDLPPLHGWTGAIDTPCQLLIVSRGFEERALAVPRKLMNEGVQITGQVLLGRYRTNEGDNDRRAEELIPLLEQICSDLRECNADEPSDIRIAVTRAIDNIPADEPLRVVFDISAASSTFILSTLLALFSQTRKLKLTVLYATAERYHEPVAEYRGRPPMQWNEADQRELGVSGVHTNELQTGIHHDHLPGFVIAIPSMFPSRLQRCLGQLAIGSQGSHEQDIYWLLPGTDSNDHKWRHDAVMQAIKDAVYSQSEADPFALPAGSFGNCGALDYKECARLILLEVERKAGTNISFIHMGTKLQALGAALALVARPEVALVYARPQSFAADRYSHGIGDIHCVVFNDILAVRTNLSTIGALTIEAC